MKQEPQEWLNSRAYEHIDSNRVKEVILEDAIEYEERIAKRMTCHIVIDDWYDEVGSCSICGERFILGYRWSYCPFCGAEIEVTQNRKD